MHCLQDVHFAGLSLLPVLSYFFLPSLLLHGIKGIERLQALSMAALSPAQLVPLLCIPLLAVYLTIHGKLYNAHSSTQAAGQAAIAIAAHAILLSCPAG